MEKVNTDHWTADGAFFICDNWKYGIAPGGTTVSLGPEKPPEAIDKPLDGKNGVTKLSVKGILPSEKIQVQETEVLLHENKGGRPRKSEGEAVSRMTTWRRGKELQGKLL